MECCSGSGDPIELIDSQLAKDELKDWRSQFVISNSDKMGLRYPPFVFTEQGVAMLSGVLNSDRAINVNIQIMRAFIKMRQLLLTHKDILVKMEQLEYNQKNQQEEIDVIFKYLEKLLKENKKKETQEKRKRIGYKKD